MRQAVHLPHITRVALHGSLHNLKSSLHTLVGLLLLLLLFWKTEQLHFKTSSILWNANINSDISALTGRSDPLKDRRPHVEPSAGSLLLIDEFVMWSLSQPICRRPLRAVYCGEIYGPWWVFFFAFVCLLCAPPVKILWDSSIVAQTKK